jgi:hypothetical protein
MLIRHGNIHKKRNMSTTQLRAIIVGFLKQAANQPLGVVFLKRGYRKFVVLERANGEYRGLCR